MFNWKQIWLQDSIARAIVLISLLVSVVPIAVFAVLSIQQNMSDLTEQSQTNLHMLAEARAADINSRLREVLHTTVIAARHSSYVLQQDISAEELQERIERYQPDQRNILGLDVYYNANGGNTALGTNLSNVYWDNTRPLSDAVARQIVLTEEMDQIFESVKLLSPDTQWIYFTSTDGMMRLFPWASNDLYPKGWDPREIIFYTVAEPSVNPNLEPRWTTPYVDFAGAGWMVTLSVPVVDSRSQMLGIMSHDITTESLTNIAFNANGIDGGGYGFLIDQYGRVIAHPDYQPHDAKKGAQEEFNLLNVGTPSFRALIQRMVNRESGFGYFADTNRNEALLAFAPIAETGWSLGLVLPRSKVIAPAIEMRNRALIITGLMMVVAGIVAIVLTRQIHQPLLRLLQGVQYLSEERENKAEKIEESSFLELRQLARAFNDMAEKVWLRETRLKAKVALFSIEVDTQRQQEQLEAIVHTDYFKQLELNAERLRNKLAQPERNDDNCELLARVSGREVS